MADGTWARISPLLARPVAFHPILARVAGGACAGLLLGQMIYVAERTADADGWFFHTQDQWLEETCLSRWEQETARKRLRAAGLIEEMRRGQPAKLFFRVNRDAVARAIEAHVIGSRPAGPDPGDRKDDRKDDREGDRKRAPRQTARRKKDDPLIRAPHVEPIPAPVPAPAESPEPVPPPPCLILPAEVEQAPAARVEASVPFPRPEPPADKAVHHLLWRVEMASGARMSNRTLNEIKGVADRLLEMATEDELLAAFAIKREQKAKRQQTYPFRFLLDDLSELLPLVRGPAGQPADGRSALEREIEATTARIAHTQSRYLHKGWLPDRGATLEPRGDGSCAVSVAREGAG